MKLVHIMALSTVLTLGVQGSAGAQEGVYRGQGYAGMEEMVVVAKRIPPAAEQRAAVQGQMEEIVVVARRIRPSTNGSSFQKAEASNDSSVSACTCLGNLGQMTARTPSL